MKLHKQPIFPIRLLLQLASFLLCLLLIVSLDATILVEDLQALTSRDGIRTILDCLAEPSAETEDPALLIPAASSDAFVKLNSTSESNTNSEEPSENIQIPTNALTSANALGAFICDVMIDMTGSDTTVSEEQVQTFLKESTVMDFVSSKISDYLSDALTGEQTASITTEDIMRLIEENEALLEKTFQIEITEEQKHNMYGHVDQALAEADLDNTFRGSLDSVMNETIHIGNRDMAVGELIQSLEWFTHLEALIDAIIVCLVLVALIMLANYYNLPQGLGWTAIACTIAGIIMAAPLVIVHFLPALLANILPQSSELLSVLDGFYFVMAPYHFALLALGLILIVVSNLWRFFYKRQNAQA